jgi:ribosome biogenesis GTPase
MSSRSPLVDPTGVLEDLGADDVRLAELSAALSAAPDSSVPGRVARSERGGADVATPGGPVNAATGETVCTGDWVIIDGSGDPPRIVAILERRTALVRRAASDETAQLLATNIDEVWVVTPLDRPVGSGRLERALVLAWESGAQPVIVATKADLADGPAIEEAERVMAVSGPGTPLVVVSLATSGAVSVSGTDASSIPGADARASATGFDGLSASKAIAVPADGENGLAELRSRLGRGRTAALLGASGAGKSSLVNALAGRDAVDVGALRAADGKGRHTTAWRELVMAEHGGVLIDSPGLRAVGMWIDAGGIDAAFSDVADLAANCRFSDCAHEGEPGCAVRAAILAGDLEQRRLDHYRKLQKEAAWAERRHDARAAAEERRVWAARTRAARGRTRRR